MKNLRYKYNRTYYKAKTKIWLKLKWKLFRLHLVTKLFKLAYKIDGEVFTSIIRGFYEYEC